MEKIEVIFTLDELMALQPKTGRIYTGIVSHIFYDKIKKQIEQDIPDTFYYCDLSTGEILEIPSDIANEKKYLVEIEFVKKENECAEFQNMIERLMVGL